MVKPVATTDTNTIYAGDADGISGNLLANDVDNGSKLTLRFLNGERVADNGKGGDNTVEGTYGTFTIYNDGSYVYKLHPGVVPAPGEELIERVSYKVANSSGETDFDYLKITIKAPNQKPVATDDFVSVDTILNNVSGNVLTNDYDPDGGSLQVARAGGENTTTPNPNDYLLKFVNEVGNTVIQGEYGTLTIDRAGNFTYQLDTGDIDYINLNGARATDSFQYRISDDEFGAFPNNQTTDVGILHIAVNDDPV